MYNEEDKTAILRIDYVLRNVFDKISMAMSQCFRLWIELEGHWNKKRLNYKKNVCVVNSCGYCNCGLDIVGVVSNQCVVSIQHARGLPWNYLISLNLWTNICSAGN